MVFIYRVFVIRVLLFIYKNVFIGKFISLKIVVFVLVRSRVKRVEGLENFNREEGNIFERLDDIYEDVSSSIKIIKIVLKGKVIVLRKSILLIWYF